MVSFFPTERLLFGAAAATVVGDTSYVFATVAMSCIKLNYSMNEQL